MKVKILQTGIYLLLIIPLLVGYIAESQCTSDGSGSIVKFDPEPSTFRYVFPYIYTSLGIAWVLSVREPHEYQLWCMLFFTLSVIALSSWVYWYKCRADKEKSLLVVVALITKLLVLFAISPVAASAWLAPVISWMVFALILMCVELQAVSDLKHKPPIS